VPKEDADRAMDAGRPVSRCGWRCVANVVPRMPRVAVSGRQDFRHLGLAAAGTTRAPRTRRGYGGAANQELFGACTNIGECEAVCPKEIKLEVIARMNHDFLLANWPGGERRKKG